MHALIELYPPGCGDSSPTGTVRSVRGPWRLELRLAVDHVYVPGRIDEAHQDVTQGAASSAVAAVEIEGRGCREHRDVSAAARVHAQRRR